MRSTQHSLSSRRRVQWHELRRTRSLFVLLLVSVLAALSYWLGYLHGSWQSAHITKADAASPTPIPLVLGDPDRILKGEPAIKYGSMPQRPEPPTPPVGTF